MNTELGVSKTELYQSDGLLKSIKRKDELNETRHEVIDFEHYLELVLNGCIKQPYINSAKLLELAIDPKNHTVLPSRFKKYHFFADRKDESAIHGSYPYLESIVRFVQSSAKMSNRSKMLLLVAPSGAGKSTIVNALTKGLEEYTLQSQEPIYAIDGCPINEHPLHLLSRDFKEELEKKYKISVSVELCPDCQLRLEQEYNHRRLDVKVRAIPFSRKLGRCISRIDAKETSYLDSYSWDIINKLYLSSNRGVLEFPEFCQHDKSYLGTLHDFIRGRTVQVNSKIYQLDTFLIGHTTLNEWEEFNKDSTHKALVERMDTVIIPFNTSVENEAAIYRKELLQSPHTQDIHISRHSLRMMAEVAIRTRLKEHKPTQEGEKMKFQDLKIEDKLKLYDGQDIEKYKQKDLPEIIEEAQKLKEGLNGLSPETMIQLARKIVAIAYDCLNPLVIPPELRKQLLMTITFNPIEKIKYYGPINETEKNFVQNTLIDLILQAFYDQFEDKCAIHFNEYLEHCEMYLNNTTKLDPLTKEQIGADEKFLRGIEQTIGISEVAKKEFRIKISSLPYSFQKQGKEFTYKSDPKLKAAIQQIVIGTAEDPKRILSNLANGLLNDPKQIELVTKVKESLTSAKYDLCLHCVDPLMKRVGHSLLQ